MEAGSTKGAWKKSFQKKTPSKIRHKIRAKIEEIQQTKEGVDTAFLLDVMGKIDNFIGVIPQDYLKNYKIFKFPAIFIVNLDLSTQEGSHWIGISISSKTVEIYDSLGMKSQFWETYPKFLIKFLGQFSKSHHILLTPCVQNPNSFSCGAYVIFYILYRRFLSLSECVNIFSQDRSLNDKILFNFLT